MSRLNGRLIEVTNIGEFSLRRTKGGRGRGRLTEVAA